MWGALNRLRWAMGRYSKLSTPALRQGGRSKSEWGSEIPRKMIDRKYLLRPLARDVQFSVPFLRSNRLSCASAPLQKPMRVTALGWRLPPLHEGGAGGAQAAEVFVELHDGALEHHQRVRVAPAALLPSAADHAHLAALLRTAAPDTFGLAPPSAVATLLRALGAALAAAAAAPPPPPPLPPPPPPLPAAALPSALAGIGDLQRVGPAMLQAAKAKMDVVFEAHQVARHDPAFVYDKRVEFPVGEAEASDWD